MKMEDYSDAFMSQGMSGWPAEEEMRKDSSSPEL